MADAGLDADAEAGAGTGAAAAARAGAVTLQLGSDEDAAAMPTVTGLSDGPSTPAVAAGVPLTSLEGSRMSGDMEMQTEKDAAPPATPQRLNRGGLHVPNVNITRAVSLPESAAHLRTTSDQKSMRHGTHRYHRSRTSVDIDSSEQMQEAQKYLPKVLVRKIVTASSDDTARPVLAARTHTAAVDTFEGACAFFDISGFSRLASRLQVAEQGSLHQFDELSSDGSIRPRGVRSVSPDAEMKLNVALSSNHRLISRSSAPSSVGMGYGEARPHSSSSTSSSRYTPTGPRFVSSSTSSSTADSGAAASSAGELKVGASTGRTPRTRAQRAAHELREVQSISTMSSGEGAEKLAMAIAGFFSRLIAEIEGAGGDIIKFAGDALICIWEPTNFARQKCTLGTLVYHAVNCGFNLASKVETVDWGSMGSRAAAAPARAGERGEVTKLALHVCVGAGPMELVQVGGIHGRWEYYIRGSGYEDACDGVDLSTPGEVVISDTSHVQLSQVLAKASQKLGARLETATRIPDTKYYKLTRLEYQMPRLPVAPIEIVPYQRDSHLHDLLAYCPLNVVHAIRHGTSRDAQLQSCTIVFIKFKGLERFKGHLEELNTLFRQVQHAVYSQSAVLRQFVVDDKGAVAVVALGFPPYSYADEPARGVTVALKVRAVAAEAQVWVQCGVTTGRVFCGNVGDEDCRCEYAAVGHVVNFSARLMGKDKEGRIFCCQNTTHRANTEYHFSTLANQLKLKGMDAPVTVCTPVRVTAPLSAANASRNHTFVGREEELSLLLKLVGSANAGSSVLIVGPEGVGKTSLMVELRQRLAAQARAAILSERQGQGCRPGGSSLSDLRQSALSRSSGALGDSHDDMFIFQSVTAGRASDMHTAYFAWRPVVRDLLGLRKNRSMRDVFLSCAARKAAVDENDATPEEKEGLPPMASEDSNANISEMESTDLPHSDGTPSSEFKSSGKMRRASVHAGSSEPMQHLLGNPSLAGSVHLLRRIVPTIVYDDSERASGAAATPTVLSTPSSNSSRLSQATQQRESMALAYLIVELLEFHANRSPSGSFLLMFDNAEYLDRHSLLLLRVVMGMLPSGVLLAASILSSAVKTATAHHRRLASHTMAREQKTESRGILQSAVFSRYHRGGQAHPAVRMTMRAGRDEPLPFLALDTDAHDTKGRLRIPSAPTPSSPQLPSARTFETPERKSRKSSLGSSEGRASSVEGDSVQRPSMSEPDLSWTFSPSKGALAARNERYVTLQMLIDESEAEIIRLETMPEPKFRAIINTRAGANGAVAQDVIARIFDMCDGNLAYGIELVTAWKELGLLVEGGDGVFVFAPAVSQDKITLPSKMVDLYKRKIDRFDANPRELGRLLSVIGVGADIDDLMGLRALGLTYVGPTARAQLVQLQGCLSQLVRDGFLVTAEGGCLYQFSSRAARDSFYSSMTFHERMKLHSKLLKHYEGVHSNQIYYAGIIAYHAEAIGESQKAITFFERSAVFAEQTGEFEDALLRYADCLRLSAISSEAAGAADALEAELKRQNRWRWRCIGLLLRLADLKAAEDLLNDLLSVDSRVSPATRSLASTLTLPTAGSRRRWPGALAAVCCCVGAAPAPAPAPATDGTLHRPQSLLDISLLGDAIKLRDEIRPLAAEDERRLATPDVDRTESFGEQLADRLQALANTYIPLPESTRRSSTQSSVQPWGDA